MDDFKRATTAAESGTSGGLVPDSDGGDVVPVGVAPVGVTPTGGTPSRARGRDSLLLIAHLQLGDERGIREVRVRNLSEGGLMLELDKVVEVGTPVRLDLRGIGETIGKVAWCTEGRMGIALDSPIDPKKARKPVGGTKPASAPFYARTVSSTGG